MQQVRGMTLDDRAAESGYVILDYNAGLGGYLLECVECGAHHRRTWRALYYGIAECHHPAVDDVRPYAEDVACQRLVQELGPMSNADIAAAFGFTRERARQVVDKAMEAFERRLKLVGLWEAYRAEVEERTQQHPLVQAEEWACDF